MKNFPLYTSTIGGEVCEKRKTLLMVVITKWSDNHENAKEIGQKVFYFTPYDNIFGDLMKEDWCEKYYERYHTNSIFRNLKNQVVLMNT